MLRRGSHLGTSSALALALVSAARVSLAQSAESAAPTTGYTLNSSTDGVIVFTGPDGSAGRVAIGCEPIGSFADTRALYVACGEGVMVRIDRPDGESNYAARRSHIDGEFVRFYSQHGHVWVEYRNLRTRLVDDPSSTVTMGAIGEHDTGERRAERCPPAQSDASSDERDGDAEVLGISSGEVVVDLGTEDGVYIGQRILLSPPEGGEERGRRAAFIVGRVSRVEQRRSRVRIVVNDHPRLHWSAALTELQPTGSLASPQRAAGMFMLGGNFGIGIGVDPAGLIFSGSLSAAYRFDAPFFVEAGAAPWGFGISFRSGPFGTATNVTGDAVLARAQGGLDWRWLSIGVGVGVVTNVPGNLHSATVGVAITQSMRAGALDGFHIALENVIAVLDGGVGWSALNGSMRIPLVSTTWLELHGGGGAAGYAFGDVGLRRTIRGNGERGSMFMTLAIGGISFFGGMFTATGPIATAGLEARL